MFDPHEQGRPLGQVRVVRLLNLFVFGEVGDSRSVPVAASRRGLVTAGDPCRSRILAGSERNWREGSSLSHREVLRAP